MADNRSKKFGATKAWSTARFFACCSAEAILALVKISSGAGMGHPSAHHHDPFVRLRRIERLRVLPLSEARVASYFRRQFAKEAGDRGPDVSIAVSIAGFRGALDLGVGAVNLADNFAVFGIEFDAGHGTGILDPGPVEPQDHDAVVHELQIKWHESLRQSPTQRFQRETIQVLNAHVRADWDVARPRGFELVVPFHTTPGHGGC